MFKRLFDFFFRWQYVDSIGNVSYYRNRWARERTCYSEHPAQLQTEKDWLWLYVLKDELENEYYGNDL